MEVHRAARPFFSGRYIALPGRPRTSWGKVEFRYGRRFTTHVDRKPLPSGGFVAHLRFEGDKKYPILNPQAIAKLTDELERLNGQSGIRALFMRSTVAGADIHHMRALTNPSEAIVFIRSVDKLCSSVQDFRVPVIAFIDGPCMGAGMELAASCDIRIAVEGAKTIFAMPETKIGIPSVVQASLLPGLIGWGRARQLLYFGGTLSVSDAFEHGFVNEVTTREDLEQVLTRWESLVDEVEPNAVIAQKVLIRTWERDGTGRAGIEASIQTFGDSFRSDIPRQRMTAYSTDLKSRKR